LSDNNTKQAQINTEFPTQKEVDRVDGFEPTTSASFFELFLSKNGSYRNITDTVQIPPAPLFFAYFAASYLQDFERDSSINQHFFLRG